MPGVGMSVVRVGFRGAVGVMRMTAVSVRVAAVTVVVVRMLLAV